MSVSKVNCDCCLAVTGAKGPPGPPGSQGNLGFQGERGDPGPQGDRGSVGMPGPPGISMAGPPGAEGVPGPPGSAGPPGTPGQVGTPGQAGLIGPPGSEGCPGFQGAIGAQGDVGSMGKTGPQGSPGSDANFCLNIETATSQGGAPTNVVKIDSNDHIRFWSAGGLDMVVCTGSALVNLEPANMLNGIGVPTTQPADPTRPAIYGDSTNNNLYFWDPAVSSGGSWVLKSDGSGGAQGAQGNDGATGFQGNIGMQGPPGEPDTGPAPPLTILNNLLANGDVEITGKLTVAGPIDPTALVLDEQSVFPVPDEAGKGTIWVKDTAPTTLLFRDDTGIDYIIGGTGAISTVVGPQGQTGSQGVPGAQGSVGSPGIDGTPGTDGIAGTPGSVGTPGVDGTPGIAGVPGPPGPAGPAGPAGADGTNNATFLSFNASFLLGADATTVNVPCRAFIQSTTNSERLVNISVQGFTTPELEDQINGGYVFTLSFQSNVNIPSPTFAIRGYCEAVVDGTRIACSYLYETTKILQIGYTSTSTIDGNAVLNTFNLFEDSFEVTIDGFHITYVA